MKWPLFHLRKATAAQRRRGRVLWTIFAIGFVALALASMIGAPDCFLGAILVGMGVSWLVIGTVMQNRGGR